MKVFWIATECYEEERGVRHFVLFEIGLMTAEEKTEAASIDNDDESC